MKFSHFLLRFSSHFLAANFFLKIAYFLLLFFKSFYQNFCPICLFYEDCRLVLNYRLTLDPFFTPRFFKTGRTATGYSCFLWYLKWKTCHHCWLFSRSHWGSAGSMLEQWWNPITLWVHRHLSTTVAGVHWTVSACVPRKQRYVL